MSDGEAGAVRAGAQTAVAQPIIHVRGLTKVYHVGDVDVHALRDQIGRASCRERVSTIV